jgi:hypothetical protein
MTGTREFFAVDLRLWRITAAVDASGARIPDTEVGREELSAHYDGSRPEHVARALYAACDAVMCAAGVVDTPACDCDQPGNPDVQMHASDCLWRLAHVTRNT